MLVRFLCPACHQLLGIAPRKVGAQVNCPKCGATILVPDPEEPRPSEGYDQPAPTDAGAADFSAMDFTAAEPTSADILPANIAAAEKPSPAGAVGSDILGDMTTYDRPAPSSPPAVPSSKRPPALDLPFDDGERIVISRRVLYFQAVLLAVVGILALAAGYLIGNGARLHGP